MLSLFHKLSKTTNWEEDKMKKVLGMGVVAATASLLAGAVQADVAAALSLKGC